MKDIVHSRSSHRASLVLLIAQTIFDKKGQYIHAFDIRNISNAVDFCVIAQGHVDKHVQAICTALKHVLEEHGEKPYRIDGFRDGSWIILDYTDIMIHLFEPDTRHAIQIEQLWTDAKPIELGNQLSTQSHYSTELYTLPPNVS